MAHKAKRLARIIEMLQIEGFASLSQLAERLETSVSTVRRDVDHLSRIGPVTRTHGGAALSPSDALSFEPDSRIACEIEAAAKAAIGRHAARLISPGSNVLFDSGTTTREVARAALARGIAFTAFTNDMAIATALARTDKIAVNVFHGRVRAGSSTLMGAETVSDINRIRGDLLFIGTHAGSVEGLSDTSTELAEVKRAFLSAATQTILVADRTKFPKRSLCTFASLSELDRIIIDDRLEAELHADLASAHPCLELAVRETP
ncbi:DeoR/GlpR family DNA-binding transcription regulator [Aurantimonas sp. A2-1-M11]|uniref:DeoR/GlpR family DNA-binding transcription regulator n=1 Tax=Aurantimonas sp. A2-1-M11 TaxID=3113712 RepID=UPI002F93133D